MILNLIETALEVAFAYEKVEVLTDSGLAKHPYFQRRILEPLGDQKYLRVGTWQSLLDGLPDRRQWSLQAPWWLFPP